MTSTTAPRTVELGDRNVTLERPTGLKASRALAILRKLSKTTPELQTELATFRSNYEAQNVLTLDRVQAKLRYPPMPLYDDDGTARLDDDGRPVLIPSPVDRLTAEDWEASGGLFRMPASPSGTEVTMALLDRSLELAEDSVYRFLALFTIPNAELKAARKEGTDDALIAAAADDLLDDAFADQIVELAVAVSETVDHHFRRKASELGDRLGNALTMLGIPWRPGKTTPEPETPTEEKAETSSASSPSSSTASDSTTTGTPTSPSTPPTTSSSPSEDTQPPTPTRELERSTTDA